MLENRKWDFKIGRKKIYLYLLVLNYRNSVEFVVYFNDVLELLEVNRIEEKGIGSLLLEW